VKLSLIYMDTGTKLFCGYGTLEPILVWNASGKVWSEIPIVVRCAEWASRISPKEASRCYPQSMVSPLPVGYLRQLDFTFEESVRLRPELFDGYDGPYMRPAPDERPLG
jgi:hypothetical protein